MIVLNNNREKLIEAIDIVDEIGSTLELEPKGRNYVGLCPFHADNNPSFTVNSEKRIYKCFVCGEGGDVVKFYRMYNHISNQAAIEALADKYKIAITKEIKQVNVLPVNNVLNDINKFYVTAMHSTEGGNVALEYLEKRGFNIETINHFHLGYGYNQGDKLFQYLEKKIEMESNYTQNDINLINHFTNKRDLFTNRLTIPIMKNGLIVGFGGRAIDDNNIKYLNSKDSKIFQKKEVLFHFDQALKLSPDNSLVVVEGFFDVIKGYQNNIKNATALMGTSFSNNHIKQLKQKRIETIFLALDNDQAGLNASVKIGNLLIKNGFKVKVIEFPDGKDLDEYLTNHTFEEFTSLKKNSINFKIFQTEQIISNVSLLSIDDKDQAINTLLENLQQENDLVIEQVLSKIETTFSVSRNYLNDKLTKSAVPQYVEPQYVEQQYVEPIDNYYMPEAQADYQHYEAVESTDDRPLVDPSNISFMSAQQLVIYRSMNDKQTFIELKRLKQQMNKDLGIYEQLFFDFDVYYQKMSIFDYVTFTNQYPKYALLISDLYNKEITENNITNQHLVEKVKNKASWGIFGR